MLTPNSVSSECKNTKKAPLTDLIFEIGPVKLVIGSTSGNSISLKKTVQGPWRCDSHRPFHFQPRGLKSGTFIVSSQHHCRVREGIGSQSLVICAGKYSGGQSQQRVLYSPDKAVKYALPIWIQGYSVLLSCLYLGCVCAVLWYGKGIFILVTTKSSQLNGPELLPSTFPLVKPKQAETQLYGL